MRKSQQADEALAVPSPGQFAYERLDRAMHERARLGIMTSLMAHPDGLLFSQLKSMCDLTDGNLKRHLDVLLEESLVSISKEPLGNRVQTLCRLLPTGRKRFLAYLEELQNVLNDAAQAVNTPVASKLPAMTAKSAALK